MSNEKNISESKAGMDYTSLRDFGLEHIRRIGSVHWTDFNIHDPGVTILEAVSLAVADLSYRSSSAMTDLLTRRGQSGPFLEGAMFPASDIFSQAPTTFEDYKKLILENVPGVRNVTFNTSEKCVNRPFIVRKLKAGYTRVKGFFDVLLELEDEGIILQDNLAKRIVGGDEAINDETWKARYKSFYCSFVRRLLLEERNLCEMVGDISVLEPLEVGINAEIEILSDFDPVQIIQDIHDTLFRYVSPTIEFHEIEDLIKRGRHAEDIIGARPPLLGYIDREELATFSKRTDLYISDVIRLLSSVPGIKSIRQIRFIVPEKSLSSVESTTWSLHLNDKYTFSLTPLFLRKGIRDKSLFCNKIVFVKNKLSFVPPMGEYGMQARPVQDVRVPLDPGFSTSLANPSGTYRETDRYFSFQNLLPKTYRMGTDTLPESAKTLRKAQRRQLKAYLTFFDQILSDYLAQIDRFQDLISINLDNNDGNSCTYFHKRLTDADVVDVSEVLEGYPEYAIPDDNPEEELRRKNDVMNHLLSMFADTFAEYAALKFIEKKGISDGQFSQFNMAENVEDKKRFLNDYPIISSRRSSAPDLNQGIPISGAERRILRKIGINDPDSRYRIASTDMFGLHIVEHTLLAPYTSEGKFLQLTKEDNSYLLSEDPYSFHVTAAMPGWTPLASDLSFREYVETIIREELPAHLMIKICWLSKSSMEILERALDFMSNFLKHQDFNPYDRFWAVNYDIYAKELVHAFDKFYNVYPGAILAADDVEDFTNEEVSRVDFAFIEGPDEIDYGDFNFPGMNLVFEEEWSEPDDNSTSEDHSSKPSTKPSIPKPPIHTWKPISPTSQEEGENNGHDFHFPGMAHVFGDALPSHSLKPSDTISLADKVTAYSSYLKSSHRTFSASLSFPGIKMLLDKSDKTEMKEKVSKIIQSANTSSNEHQESSGRSSGINADKDLSFPGKKMLLENKE